MNDFFRIADAVDHDPRLYLDAPTIGYARISAPEVWVFAEPDVRSARQTQYTFGEALRIVARHDDWLHAQSLRDGYCGWLPNMHALHMTQRPDSHSHSTRYAAPITATADLKSTPVCLLPPDATFTPTDQHGDYFHIPDLGWIHQHHTMRLDERIDPITTARELIGKSYVWGGRSVAGLDCSALAQLCYRRAGQAIPRDADLQACYLHTHHISVALTQLQPADLLFIPGHVMIATGTTTIIHASGYDMRVVEEPLHTALERYQQTLNERYHLRIYRW